MKAKGCLIALAVVLGLGFVLAALVGPRLLKEGERFYRPIAKMQNAQKDFEAWEEQHAFKEPTTAAITAEELSRFLALRKKLAAIDEANPLPENRRFKNEKPSLDEIEGLIEGVGGNVTGRMQAYLDAGMPSAEYRYLDRLIYRNWLRPLRTNGQDPASVARAIKEILDAAQSERDPSVQARLRAIAAAIGKKRVAAPDGIPEEIHNLLFSHVTEIDALIDVGAPTPIRRR